MLLLLCKGGWHIVASESQCNNGRSQCSGKGWSSVDIRCHREDALARPRLVNHFKKAWKCQTLVTVSSLYAYDEVHKTLLRIITFYGLLCHSHPKLRENTCGPSCLIDHMPLAVAAHTIELLFPQGHNVSRCANNKINSTEKLLATAAVALQWEDRFQCLTVRIP